MCIICVSRKGIRQPSDKTIAAMYSRNPHGAGYMYARDGMFNAITYRQTRFYFIYYSVLHISFCSWNLNFYKRLSGQVFYSGSCE